MSTETGSHVNPLVESIVAFRRSLYSVEAPDVSINSIYGQLMHIQGVYVDHTPVHEIDSSQIFPHLETLASEALMVAQMVGASDGTLEGLQKIVKLYSLDQDNKTGTFSNFPSQADMSGAKGATTQEKPDITNPPRKPGRPSGSKNKDKSTT